MTVVLWAHFGLSKPKNKGVPFCAQGAPARLARRSAAHARGLLRTTTYQPATKFDYTVNDASVNPVPYPYTLAVQFLP